MTRCEATTVGIVFTAMLLAGANAGAGMIRTAPPIPIRAPLRAMPIHCVDHALRGIGVDSFASVEVRVAVQVFNVGRSLYARHRYRDAARAFLVAAGGLPGANRAFLRMAAYENAADAWANTGSMDEAHVQVAALIIADVENREALLELSQHLPEPCPASVVHR